MSEFDKREESFENKFAHDEEVLFKVLAHANRMVGLWAAEKLGKTGAEAEAYAKALVERDVAAHDKSGVLGQIHKDFTAAGVAQSEHQIARHFEEFRAQAAKDVTR
ncbi:DUF1476 domain-containing protein [Rhodoblastus sp.]|jgi:hypothetical protein|uniref:DUF1476 domain-containing protein n=1 Tax=Rhodoblastus sp. TaxID=1962975 RepID=UPI00263303C9|nr:DUF1476 domain-containing protein [Rhodoblastus sp.]